MILSITACEAGSGTAKDEGKDGPPYVGTVLDDDGSEDSSETDAVSEDEYTEQGYVPISMKNDFLKIYPDTIKRSDEQYIEPEEEMDDAA